MEPKELARIYKVLELSGQLFEGGLLSKLFAHILGLHKMFEFQNEVMNVLCGGEEG